VFSYYIFHEKKKESKKKEIICSVYISRRVKKEREYVICLLFNERISNGEFLLSNTLWTTTKWKV